ncbi:hypothetical protein [Patulibacter sp.]|uniref:hypothetical protein n=1 Tax=Patulibacter sp. TaxID=1912859 RepID=UPI002716B9AD|nr:hypothetical protein [Patulibacter sp.]MDO9409918.1 hypothetical protein [Patulibacter sp.]
MADRPRWTTLNLAALSAATAASRIPRMSDLVGTAAARDGLLRTLADRFPLVDAAELRLLERAVVLERIVGGSWESIGAILGESPTATEVRFAGAERGFLMAEAFPVRRGPGGNVRRVDPEVLLGADAWMRTLDGLAPAWVPLPSTLLRIGDETWLAYELDALGRMRSAVHGHELPEGVDPLEARLAYESRRLASLAWDVGRDRSGTPDMALLDAIAEATAECAGLVAALAGQNSRQLSQPMGAPVQLEEGVAWHSGPLADLPQVARFAER